MAPTPEECVEKPSASVSSGSADTIVISGISGLYPESNHVKDFSKILFEKINPITSENCRWSFKHPETSDLTGKVPNLEYFDAQFFKVTSTQASNMDATGRKILEQSFQAIYDAGICPTDFLGKRIGVFVASTLVEKESSGQLYELSSRSGLSITGGSKTMIANRISYWLDLKGPSLTYDSACTGSFTVLQRGLEAIMSGECEAAIVGSINCISSPHNIVHFRRCIQIASDGKTKSFDENADGCCKSDAIVVMLLQKSKDALRSYAELVHAKVEFISRLENELGQKFGFVRDPSVAADFLKTFYKEAGVSPHAVEYVDAVGCATLEADKTELQALEKVFCDGRKNPLLVGSVMSNAGFSDCVLGLVALTKVLLGYHTGKIAGNMHCENPRKDLASLQNGTMRIVRENESINHTYCAINGLSVTGNNAHLLLRGCFKPKDKSRYKSSLPRIVTISGRQEESVLKIFSELKSHPIDPEELALLHNIHSSYIFGHLGRGYIILDSDDEQNTRCLKEYAQHTDDANRPLWFVYSGMGSQWAGMGAQLMRIPIFAKAIERCHKALEPKGIDLIDLITTTDASVFNNVLHSFVGIAAVQIGLTDILSALGILPDKIIGHSVGELGCAYADGCVTAEEMILFAYYRGVVSNENITSRGAMAAVGIGYNKIKDMCPEEIDVACHNGPDSCTISGPEDKLRQFVQELKSTGIFAKEVPCSNIAYHSRYIAEAAPHLLKHLMKVLHEPRLRSKKWLSTSVPQEKWNEAKYCSAEYMTNNLLNPVLFEETSKNIPPNAVLIEIAPHGLLQAILKRSLSEDCVNIPLTKKNHKNSLVFLLDAIGKLYIEGFNPKVQVLYPEVEFPVSTGTPHLSHLVDWSHTVKWDLCKLLCIVDDIEKAAQCRYKISIHDDEYSYLRGNIVQGETLYPFGSALVAVWETLAMILSVPKTSMCIKFQDVHLYSQPIITENKLLELEVFIHRANGRFEILENTNKVASGFVTAIDSKKFDMLDTIESYDIDSKEVYDHFAVQGYSYREEFQSIHRMKTNEVKSHAQLKWNNNWATLLDGLLQLNYLHSKQSGYCQPSQIRELILNANKHSRCVETLDDGTKVLDAVIHTVYDRTECGGIKMHNVKFRKIPHENISSNVTLKLYSSGSDFNSNKIANEEVTSEYILPKNTHIALTIGTPCNFESLTWVNVPEKDGLKVQVHYAGINMYDVKRATGIIPFDDNQYFGMDYSGTLENGDHVMGIVDRGAVSNTVMAHSDLTWKVPSHWTLEDAATVPLAYAQAYYYMLIKNELRPYSRVLIHGGAGALGQAAISIALAYNCEVFTTVSTVVKKQLLMELFPELKEDHIASSRNADFSDMVLTATNGKGCHLILSCVQGDLKNECLKCTAFSGTTVDISQLQHNDKFVYGMYHMTKSRSYMCVDFNTIFKPENHREIKEVHLLITSGIASGIVRPLTRVVYSADETPRAFRLLFTSKHCGRVLLRLKQTPPITMKRIACDSDKSYLIIWDGDSFGLRLADKLISRGTKKLHIHCLNSEAKLHLQMRIWEIQGAQINTSFGNITSKEDIDKILKKTNYLGDLGEVYVTATENNRIYDLSTIVCYLDEASKELCPSMKLLTVITVNKDMELQYYRPVHKTSLTVINLPELSKVNEKLSTTIEKSVWDQLAIDVIDDAVCSPYRVLDARAELKERKPLSELIMKLLDADKINAYKQNVSFSDLKLNDELISYVSTYLKNKLHMHLSEENILALNKEKLMKLESPAQSYKSSRGLSVFFQHVDSDEINATVDTYFMDTLVTDRTILQSEWDIGDNFLCVVPGVEGHNNRYKIICERLKVPALILQPGLDHPNEDAEHMAQRMSKVILNKTGIKDKFLLLGHEFGIPVVLALAGILEDKGLSGTVFCIGPTPVKLIKEVEDSIKEFPDDDALKLGIARHLFSLMTNTEVTDSHKDYKTWEHFIYDTRKELGSISLTMQYVKLLIESAYGRIRTARTLQYIPHKIKSQIVHMRTGNNYNDVSTLQQYSTCRVIEYELDVPLAHCTDDLRCAAIINRHLPQHALEEYNNRNLCVKYNKTKVLKAD